MMDERQIKKAATNHRLICFITVVGLEAITTIITKFWLTDCHNLLVDKMFLAACFYVVESLAITYIWQWVATRHKDYLATFHTACSGFRMLLVLAALGIICAVEGRDAMVPYVVIFMVYYFIMLIMHSVFFTKTTQRLFANK